MPIDIRCAPLLSAALAGCSLSPPPPANPRPTVFDDLVEKQRTLPAAVEQAQQRRVEALRREALEADGGAGAEPKR